MLRSQARDGICHGLPVPVELQRYGLRIFRRRGLVSLVGLVGLVSLAGLVSPVGLVSLVSLVGLVGLVGLVSFVSFVGLVGLVSLVGLVGLVGPVGFVGLAGLAGLVSFVGLAGFAALSGSLRISGSRFRRCRVFRRGLLCHIARLLRRRGHVVRQRHHRRQAENHAQHQYPTTDLFLQ